MASTASSTNSTTTTTAADAYTAIADNASSPPVHLNVARQCGTRRSPILLSAQFLAALRRDETALPTADKLVHDPFAAQLADSVQLPTAFLLRGVDMSDAQAVAQAEARRRELAVERAERPEQLVRCRWMDEQLATTIQQLQQQSDQPVQIVLLGAGLDTRAYRMACLRATTVYEVDQQAIIDYKQRVLQSATPAADKVVRIAADVTQRSVGKSLNCHTNSHPVTLECCEQLLAHGFDQHRPTVFVCEGLLMYLSQKQSARLLRNLSSLCCSCSPSAAVLLADVVNTAMASSRLQYYHMFRHGLDAGHIPDWLQHHGWQSAVSKPDDIPFIGLRGVSYGRYMREPLLSPQHRPLYTLLVHATLGTRRRTDS